MLADIEAIKQLKARYCRFLDTKQWGQLREQFTDDCAFDGTSRTYHGPDDFVADMSERLSDAVTVHQGHMPEITITTEGHARGIWAMFDLVEFGQPRDLGRGLTRGFTGYGYYEEEYRYVGTTWKISVFRLTRLRLDSLPA